MFGWCEGRKRVRAGKGFKKQAAHPHQKFQGVPLSLVRKAEKWRIIWSRKGVECCIRLDRMRGPFSLLKTIEWAFSLPTYCDFDLGNELKV